MGNYTKIKRSYSNYTYLFLVTSTMLTACNEVPTSHESKQSSIISSHAITEKEAVQLAEQFININGYSTFLGDTNQLTLELADRTGESKTEIVKRRFHTLHENAFCVMALPDVWHIGFISSNENLSDTAHWKDWKGRAVIVDRESKKVRIAHKDPLFSFFHPLK